MEETRQYLSEIFQEYAKDFSEEEFNCIIREEIDNVANILSYVFSEHEENHARIISEIFSHNKNEQLIVEHSLQKDALSIIRQITFKALAELRKETK